MRTEPHNTVLRGNAEVNRTTFLGGMRGLFFDKDGIQTHFTTIFGIAGERNI